MDTQDNYYKLLGVDSQASSETIKAAFKKLALQYHPDVYKGADAQERMRHLLQAYQTLSDPDARKAYDARRPGQRVTTIERREGGEDARERRPAEQGRFAFPDLSSPRTAPLLLKLDGNMYQLTSEQVDTLWWDGLMRGASTSGTTHTCQRCHHTWPTATREGVPAACPACHARDWAEYLLLRCTHCQAVFASAEIHDPLRGDALYQPYELFPLCPNCRRSQWCPVENKRVAALRAAAARRNAFFLGGLFAACLLLVVIVALVLLR